MVLVNSVLDSLPAYTMALFSMPVSVSRRLDKIRRDFLWQRNKDRRSFNLVKWNTVFRSKKFGGLGIRDLNAHNSSQCVSGSGVSIKKKTLLGGL